MKLLYWTNEFWPLVGGVQVIAARLLPLLKSFGFQIQVVCDHTVAGLPDRDAFQEIAIRRFPFYQALAARDVSAVTRIIEQVSLLKRSFRPDLVHFNLTNPSVFFHLVTAPAARCPTILAVRLSITQEEAGPETLLGRAVRSAEWITANSGFVLNKLRSLVPGIVGRSSVVYNGLEMPSRIPAPFPRFPVLLGLGRLVPEKGYDLAIRGFARIAARFPDLRMVLGGDGPARPELEQLVRELGLNGRVEFRGWIAPEAVPDFMNTGSIVLVPSRWQEAFGLVALQAGQMARPVIATAVGGLPEVVAHGETGLVVEPENPDAIADAVSELLTSSERAEGMGRAAREAAATRFSWNAYVESYLELYRRVSPIKAA